ncbi:uncharacterized protein LOC117329604 [Pecten maximus]|uniref:uncharacterized protein LOC117329604 n=1 Tax=Pecten maximus TaxID=6579 RepID=UPI0014580B9F|nr:uncharacterized protein LOC117329604 [Pecten maximus]
MNTQFCLLLFLLGTGYSLGAKFSSKCFSDADCPEHAECLIRGCEGSICLCKLNYIPTDDYSKCIRVAEIGEKCDETTRCRGIRSRCAANGICQCQSGYTPTQRDPSDPLGNQTLCKKALTDWSYALLGEKCSPPTIECEETDTHCIKDMCICKENFREATKQEQNAYPFNFFQCVKNNFRLNVSVSQSECSLYPAPAHPTVNTQVLATTTTSPLSTINGLTSGLLIASQTATASIFTPSTSALKQTMSSESFVSLTNMSSSLSAPFNTEATLSSVMPTSSSLTSPTTGEFHTDVTTSTTGGIDLFASTQGTTTSRTLDLSPSLEISLSHTSLFTPSLNSKQILSSPVVAATPIRITLSSSIVAVQTSIAIKTSNLQTVSSRTSAHPLDTSLWASAYPLGSSGLVTSLENTTPLKSSEYIHVSTEIQQSTAAVTGIHSNTVANVATNTPTSVIMSQSNQVMTSSVSLHPTPSSNHNLSSKAPSTPGTTVISTTPIVGFIGQRCLKGHVCPSHSICELDLCGVNRCRCLPGFIVHNGGIECIPLSALGSVCVSDAQCIGPNTKCHNNACTCQSNYILNNDKTRCKRDTEWFVAFPLLHGKCRNFFADCYNDFEQECSTGRCKCKLGLREASLNDIYDKHKSYSQCRNSTLPTDFRSQASCDGDLIQEEPDPTSEEAERKIKVMKGAIIGGICGFVFLLASAVTIILLVRHKRRTKIRHIRTDTTSLNSFDRRSSGKYSFRLPRPFAFDLGKDKEWEAEHLSVHNSEFEPTTDNDTVLTLKDTDGPSMNGTFSNPIDVSDSPIQGTR